MAMSVKFRFFEIHTHVCKQASLYLVKLSSSVSGGGGGGGGG